jgi:hypothetical protein
MGDTGALAIGGVLAVAAILTKTELLLPIIGGGIYVLEALSVIIQYGFFSFTRKRVFKMAPIHHHFELSGWEENKVVVRFWIYPRFRPFAGVGFVRLPTFTRNTTPYEDALYGLGESGRRLRRADQSRRGDGVSLGRLGRTRQRTEGIVDSLGVEGHLGTGTKAAGRGSRPRMASPLVRPQKPSARRRRGGRAYLFSPRSPWDSSCWGLG